MLPPVDQATGLLPPAAEPYRASLEDVYDRFVAGAPYREQRETIMSALALYAELVWILLPGAVLRVDGGFVTHKTWAAPADVDVVVLASGVTPQVRQEFESRGLVTIMQAQGVANRAAISVVPKLHPMGGLVDAFLVDRNDLLQRQFFEAYWASVKGPDSRVIPGVTKGYVEVINPNV